MLAFFQHIRAPFTSPSRKSFLPLSSQRQETELPVLNEDVERALTQATKSGLLATETKQSAFRQGYLQGIAAASKKQLDSIDTTPLETQQGDSIVWSAVKGITWRVFSTLMTVFLAFTIFGGESLLRLFVPFLHALPHTQYCMYHCISPLIKIGRSLCLFEVSIKFVLYFVHKRFWAQMQWR